MTITSVGILGLGTYLPPQIRTNAHWSAAVVAGWVRARAAARAAAPPPPPAATVAIAKVLAAMAAQADDPFQGAVERRIVADDQEAIDLEEAAARDAIARAGVAASAIDLVMTHTPVPAYQLSNSACPLHHRLGLAPGALALEADAAGYSFLAQLALADGMIRSGAARFALLTQSSVASRLVAHDDPIAPLFGDGATAVVIGPVAPGRGVLATRHRTLGTLPATLIAAVPGRRWYDDGRAVLHLPDPAAMHQLLLDTVDRGHEVITAALAAAGLGPDQVDVFGVHQGSAWLRRVTQDHVGLTRARAVDTFAHTGHLFAASIPLDLRLAEDTGALAADDVVALFGGGTGMIYGSTILRWGGAA